jgi:hypothetical protein
MSHFPLYHGLTLDSPDLDPVAKKIIQNVIAKIAEELEIMEPPSILIQQKKEWEIEKRNEYTETCLRVRLHWIEKGKWTEIYKFELFRNLAPGALDGLYLKFGTSRNRLGSVEIPATDPGYPAILWESFYFGYPWTPLDLDYPPLFK